MAAGEWPVIPANPETQLHRRGVTGEKSADLSRRSRRVAAPMPFSARSPRVHCGPAACTGAKRPGSKAAAPHPHPTAPQCPRPEAVRVPVAPRLALRHRERRAGGGGGGRVPFPARVRGHSVSRQGCVRESRLRPVGSVAVLFHLLHGERGLKGTSASPLSQGPARHWLLDAQV